MSTNTPHTVLITAMAICLAALLAVATSHRERSTGLTPAVYDAVSSR